MEMLLLFFLQLLPNLYHVGSVSWAGASGLLSSPIQETLESMAGEVTRVVDEQLKVCGFCYFGKWHFCALSVHDSILYRATLYFIDVCVVKLNTVSFPPSFIIFGITFLHNKIK